MSYRRLGLLVASVAVLACATVDGASARRLHRHHAIAHGTHTFVFRSPGSASVTASAGYVAGYLLPGFIGATTADPYEHPSYGYYVGGGQGPGYSYYGD